MPTVCWKNTSTKHSKLVFNQYSSIYIMSVPAIYFFLLRLISSWSKVFVSTLVILFFIWTLLRGSPFYIGHCVLLFLSDSIAGFPLFFRKLSRGLSLFFRILSRGFPFLSDTVAGVPFSVCHWREFPLSFRTLSLILLICLLVLSGE